MKRSVLLLLLCIPVGLGFSFRSYKQVDASSIGTDTLVPFVLSTNMYVSSMAYISFDNGEPMMMNKLISNDSTSLFAINVRSSQIGDRVYFQGDQFSFNSEISSTCHLYKVLGASTGTYSNSNVGKINTYLDSSYETRRLWFKFSTEVSGLPRVVCSGVGYMMNSIINNIDGDKYYFVDVPSNSSTYAINYISSDAESNYSIISSREHSNSDMHKIRYIDVSKKTISIYNPVDGYDQYLINEYLRGYTSCLESDKNGYLSYQYMNDVLDNFVSYQGGNLEDVYQNDYTKDDYDETYKDHTIRDGYNVSAYDKLNEISSNYLRRNNKVISPIVDNNNLMITIIVLSVISISTVGGYLLLRNKKKR